MKQSMINQALKYYDMGFAVIPAIGKTPQVKWSRYNLKNRPTKAQIIDWWKKNPDYNIAIITGLISQVAVVDFDSIDAYKKFKDKLPTTWAVRTSRGIHLYYKVSEKITSRKTDMFDLKAEGGIVIAPPSIHPSGVRYFWLYPPQNVPLSELPDWVKNESCPVIPARDIFNGVKEGRRNVSLAKLTGIWIKAGMSYEEVLTCAKLWNQLNNPPLDEQEVLNTVNSIWKRDLANKEKMIKTITMLKERKSLTLQDLQQLPADILKVTSLMDLMKIWNQTRS